MTAAVQAPGQVGVHNACVITWIMMTNNDRRNIYNNQSINQLHVFLARGEPKKGATPKPPLVIPNR
jgi:hypothetical protein